MQGHAGENESQTLPRQVDSALNRGRLTHRSPDDLMGQRDEIVGHPAYEQAGQLEQGSPAPGHEGCGALATAAAAAATSATISGSVAL
jgi:hypothetical protein